MQSLSFCVLSRCGFLHSLRYFCSIRVFSLFFLAFQRFTCKEVFQSLMFSFSISGEMVKARTPQQYLGTASRILLIYTLQSVHSERARVAPHTHTRNIKERRRKGNKVTHKEIHNIYSVFMCFPPQFVCKCSRARELQTLSLHCLCLCMRWQCCDRRRHSTVTTIQLQLARRRVYFNSFSVQYRTTYTLCSSLLYLCELLVLLSVYG